MAGKGDPEYTRHALDDRFGAKNKEYAQFGKKYPMKGKLYQQEEKLKLLESWCEQEKIAHTPALFINGRELPKKYQMEDM